MTDKQLISKIKELREIKPSKDWVVSLKIGILGKEQERFSWGFIREIGFIFQYKKALATVAVFGVLLAIFGVAQNALPGDTLYPLKKITERSRTLFSPEGSQSRLVFEVANKRLDDLTRVAENNSVKNLAPAINEYKASVAQVVKNLTKGTSKISVKATKEIALEVKKLEEKEQIVASLGVEIGGNKELDNALSQLVEKEIKDLEGRTLAKDQQEILGGIKSDFGAKNYSQALEKILLLNP